MSIVAPKAASVYLYYDARDVLIYVGITGRGARRQNEHNRDKEWWPLVAHQELEHFDTRADAADRERELIRRHLPPFNTQHNPAHEMVRQAYLLFAAAQAEPMKWRESVRARHMQVRLEPHGFGDYDHVVLRTSTQDADISVALQNVPADWDQPRAFGYSGKKARLAKVENWGPIALLHLTATSAHPILDATASLKFHRDQTHLLVGQVTVRLDHRDHRTCTHRCPKGA